MAKDTVGADEPADLAASGDTSGSVDPMAASNRAAQPPATTSPPPAAADSPSRYAGGGSGGGGPSTPNAGMGGGGPTGGGGANLHLPGITSLQQYLPNNATAVATNRTANTPAALGSPAIASNAVTTPVVILGSQTAQPAHSPPSSAAVQSPTAPLPPPTPPAVHSPPAPPAAHSPPAPGSSSGSHTTGNAVKLGPSSLTLRSSTDAAVAGQMVTFTVTVSSSVKGPKPTGTVVFTNGGQTLGNASLRNGTAAFTTSALPVGSYNVRAAYQGDNHFLPGAATQGQTVQPDSTALGVQSRQAQTATGLAVTFTASVYPVAPGSGTPTGTVDFRSGSVELGRASLRGNAATLTVASTAVVSGAVTAFYEGDSQFRGSQGSLPPANPSSGSGSGSGSSASSGSGSGTGSGSSSSSADTTSQSTENFTSSGSGSSGNNSIHPQISPMSGSGTIGPEQWVIVPGYTAATVAPISTTEGQVWSGTVLKSLYDPDPSVLYIEQVSWGDGTYTPAITIGSSGSSFPVLSHQYTLAGSYHMTDVVTALGPVAPKTYVSLESVTLNTDALITPVNLHLTAATITVAWSHTLTNAKLATFVVPGGKAGNYSATIDWGDGSGPLAATILSQGNGTFAVEGSHFYVHPGTFITDIIVEDINDNVREALGRVKVVPPYKPPDLVLTAFDTMMYQKDGVDSATVATFTIGDTSLTVNNFAASIDWGDGSMPYLGTITGSGGSFKVKGTHFYPYAGQYLLTVNVVSPLDTALAWATAHVGAPTGTLSLQNLTQLAPRPNPFSPQDGAILVGVYKTPNKYLTASDFQAWIAWGDQSKAEQATVTGSAGTFWISAFLPYFGYQGGSPYVYQAYTDSERYLAQITIYDGMRDSLNETTFPVTVLNGGATDGHDAYNEATWLKPAWFHVTYPTSISNSANYAIGWGAGWGDGFQSAGGPYYVSEFPWFIMESPNATYAHAYPTEGTYTQKVRFLFFTSSNTGSPALASVRPFAGSPPPPPPPLTTVTLAVASQSVVIGDGALKNWAPGQPPITLHENTLYSNSSLFSFEDYETSDSAPGIYSATIDWADGTKTTGTIGEMPYNIKYGDRYTVGGSHTYLTVGKYYPSVLIRDKDGAAEVIRRTITVVSPPAPASIALSSTTRTDDPDRAHLVPAGEATLDLNMGAVRISQPLDFDASPGTSIGGNPSLVYNSATVSKPVLLVTFTATTRPSSVNFTLTWQGTTLAPVAWTPPASQTGNTYVATITVSSAVTASGHYNYFLKANTTISGVHYLGTVSGVADVVVNTSSPYGAGWGLQDTTRLVSDTKGDLMRIDGAGDERLFSLSSNGTYTTPAEDFGTLTGGLAVDYYLYTSKDQTKYYYDLNGRLYKVVQPNEWVTTLSYSAGLLSTFTTPDHAVTNFNYGGGWLTSIDEPGSRVVSLANGGNVTQITDAAGFSRIMSYDGTHHLTVDGWLPYDSTFGYSPNELLNSLSQSPVSETFTVANSALALNASGLPLALSITPPLSPGGQAYTTDYLLDTRGRELWQEQSHATLTAAPTAVWSLDNAGDVTQYVDYDNLTTGYAYDKYGDLLQISYPNGANESYQYDSIFHNVTQHTDPDGHVTVYQYDGLSELTLQTIGYGSPVAATTKNFWVGGLITETIDPVGNTTEYNYSTGLGFLLLSQTILNSAGVAVSSQSYTYDAAGNPSSMIDSDKGATQYKYDADNNLTQTIDPDGYTTSQVYDPAGLEISSTDGRGIQANYSYDYAGLETSDDLAANKSDSEDTTDAYNATGEQTLIVDPTSSSTSMAYSPAGSETLMIQGYGTANAATTSSFYDPDGNLTETIDPDGNVSTYTYDLVGNQTLAIIGYGTAQASTTSTAYDADGDVTQIIEGYGSSVATTTDYAFDADGNQSSATTGAGSSNPDSISSSYDGDGNLTLQIDNGNLSTSSFAYDADGNQTRAIRGIGTSVAATTKNYYDGDSNLTLSVDARGYSASYSYDGDGNETLEIQGFGTPAASTTSMAYDPDANETLVVQGYNSPAASSISYGFDFDGNQTQSIAGLNMANAATTSTSYDLDNRVTQQVDADKNTSSYSYDALGDQTLSVLAAGTTQVTSTTDYYDGDSNLTLQVDADKNSTSYQYDSNGNRTLTIVGVGTNAVSSTSSAYDAVGQATLVVDALGTASQTTTSYAYDAHGSQTLQINGMGSNVAATTQSSYDGDSNLTQTIDADGNTSKFAFDALGDQTQTVQGSGSSKAATSDNYYDGDGNLTLSVNADGDSTTYFYDADNNETLMIQGYNTPAASSTSIFYDVDGHETEQIQGYNTPAASITSYAYDADGDQTLEITGLGSSNPDTITSKYDGDGNLTQQTDSGNPHTIEYQFDALGNQTEEIQGYGTTQQISTEDYYDGDGNLTVSVDARGYSTSYQYDPDGRETLMVAAYGTSAAESTSYFYNADNEQTEMIQAVGTSAQTTTSYAYDADGNQTQQVVGLGSNVAATTISYYDGDGNLTQQIDPDLHTTDYYFDPLGNQSETLQGPAPVWPPPHRNRMMATAISPLKLMPTITARRITMMPTAMKP